MATFQDYSTHVQRFYIDTRPLVPPGPRISRNNAPTLPLLTTLPQENQDAITRFLQNPDKFMSLASALLKFTFIHRTARIPWADVRISKTPKPHGRPYWKPLPGWQGDEFAGLEFNVSHQAGLVILAGCTTPNGPEVSLGMSQHDTSVTPDPTSQQQIRIGVDVTCVKEPGRTQDLSTQPKLDEWVDTFSEMFSERERKDMKQRPVPASPDSKGDNSQTYVMDQKARRFYTYWALKEAYIKMVGEGLLADWLRQLEFVNVVSPDPSERLIGEDVSMKILLENKDISKTIHTELDGFEEQFLFTMITRGIDERNRDSATWKSLTIEEIRPCAEGTCSCLK